MQGENQSAIGQFSEVSSVGGLIENSRKVPDASAYRTSCVVMYCAGLKGDCAALNIDSSSLPNKEGARF